MRPFWILFAVTGLTAGPALGQPLIPPTHQYATPAPTPLDKDYGLPTFGRTGLEVPQPKTMAPKAAAPAQTEAFKGFSSFATPDAQTADTPDFFQGRATVSSTGTSDVPNFFDPVPDNGLAKVQRSRPGYATIDTPTYTTTDGSSTGDSPFNRPLSGDTISDHTLGGVDPRNAAAAR